jgi:hypothetical protein
MRCAALRMACSLGTMGLVVMSAWRRIHVPLAWMQSHTTSTHWVTMSHCHSLARKEDNSIVPRAEPIRRRWRSSRPVAMAVRMVDYMYYSACHLTDAPLSMGALSAACHTMGCTVQTTANLRPACQIACCILRRCMMGSHQASPRQQRCTQQAIASRRIARRGTMEGATKHPGFTALAQCTL